MKDEKKKVSYTVEFERVLTQRVAVEVMASSPEEAEELAGDDLDDPELEWDEDAGDTVVTDVSLTK